MTIALLAPVPERYVLEGVGICQTFGFVAYGSGWPGEFGSGEGAWQFFQRAETALAQGDLVLVYVSKSGSSRAALPQVETISFIGEYAGYELANERPFRNPENRPKEAIKTDSQAVLFWFVRDLRQLSQPVAPHRLRFARSEKGGALKKGASVTVPVRGPALIFFDRDIALE